jgi:hypothetical protein
MRESTSDEADLEVSKVEFSYISDPTIVLLLPSLPMPVGDEREDFLRTEESTELVLC